MLTSARFCWAANARESLKWVTTTLAFMASSTISTETKSGRLLPNWSTEGLIYQNSHEYSTLGVTDKGWKFLKERQPLTLSKPKRTERRRRERIPSDDTLDDDLFEHLRRLRISLARELEVPAFVIFNDAALKDMARRRPRTREEFGRMSGVGTVKLRQFGDRFLAEIRQYLNDNPETTESDPSTFPYRPRASETRAVNRNGSTYSKTLDLLNQGMSASQVAHRRELAVGTIVSHVEMLVANGFEVDLKPSLPRTDRMVVIEAALDQQAAQRRSCQPCTRALAKTSPTMTYVSSELI